MIDSIFISGHRTLLAFFSVFLFLTSAFTSLDQMTCNVLHRYAGIFDIVLGGGAMLYHQIKSGQSLPAWDEINPTEWVCIVLLPLCGTANLVVRTAALRMTKDVNVLLMWYGVVVFSLVLHAIFLGQPIPAVSICGVLIIVGVGVYLLCDQVRKEDGPVALAPKYS
jgi:hypothetical protein